MRKLKGYFLADVKRAFVSLKFLMAIVLMIIILFFAMLEGIALDTNVLYVFSIVMYGMPSMIVLVCAAIPYADSFCEDVEKRYIFQIAIRGGIKNYVSVRVLSIFLSAMVTTSLGLFLYVLILHLRLEWVDMEEVAIQADGYSYLLKRGWYWAYYLSYGIRYGTLAGLLSLWSSCLSLYLPNRMLTLAAPMIIYYFIDFILAKLFQGLVNLSVIFSPGKSLYFDESFAISLVVGIVIINFWLLRRILMGALRGKIYE